MKLEIKKEDIDHSIELNGKVKAAEAEDIEPKERELKDKVWIAHEALRRAQAVGDQDVFQKFTIWENLRNELQAIRPRKNKNINSARADLEVVSGPYKIEMDELPQKEGERFGKLKDHKVSSERLWNRKTDSPVFRVTTNIDTILKTLQTLFTEKRELKEKICDLDTLRKEFDRILAAIPKQFPLSQELLLGKESLLFFQDQFKQPLPKFDVAYWPDVDRIAAASRFLETLESLKIKISDVRE